MRALFLAAMKTLPLIALPLFLAACQSQMEIQTIHVFTTLTMEKNCTQPWLGAELSEGVPPGGFVCQRPTTLLIMHLQSSCLDSTDTWTEDGWTFLGTRQDASGPAFAEGLDIPALSGTLAAQTGDGVLYNINAGGGVAPANNSAVQTSFEDDQLVFRYGNGPQGTIVQKVKTTLDVESVTVGIESESVTGCLSGPSW
jgi:hypothetical protein